jgi:hypothetical protein
MLRTFTVGLLLCLLLVGAALAQEGKAEKVKAAEAGKVQLLADQSGAIKTALDTDGFKLPDDIGAKIDTARESGNPGDLWPLSLSLWMAEKASGKTSDLVSSMQLVEEATEKARRNKDATNLTMAGYVYQQAGDDAMAATLLAEAQAAGATGTEKAGPYTFDLEVNNYWDEAADVYLEDWFLGTVYPGYYMYWNDIAIGYYYLYAYGVVSGGYTVVDVPGTAYGFTSVDLVY